MKEIKQMRGERMMTDVRSGRCASDEEERAHTQSPRPVVGWTELAQHSSVVLAQLHNAP